MSQYLDENHLNIAKEVRKLVSENKGANELSFEIVKYLRNKYPNNFIINKIEITNEEWEYFKPRNMEKEENFPIIKQIVKSYYGKVDNYNILILYHRNMNILAIFNKNGSYSYFKIPNKGRTYMSKEFYNFMNEIGLTIPAANNLYDLRAYEKSIKIKDGY